MKSDPEIHQRKSIRLKDFDYSQAGGYFVTVVTFRREYLFGEVAGGEMQLNALGRIVRAEWFRSVKTRKEIRLFADEFVVMPNHIHGIVWIDIDSVGADGVRPVEGIQSTRVDDFTGDIIKATRRVPLQRKPKSLGSFIAGYKSSVTRRARIELNSGNIWQRNYYEHIIRNDDEHNRIHLYIESNPINWMEDQENPGVNP